MTPQTYATHVRYYPPHHFVFLPLAFLLFLTSLYLGFTHADPYLLWGFVSVALGLNLWVGIMLRQHYALGNQNRIVRLELRFRYYVLTQQRLENLESRLTFGQLAALRFASDEELPALVQRTLTENLSPDEIKKAVVNWNPDYMRV